MSARIAIVGAGPTGLALGLMAQGLGHDVVIYEAAPLPDPRPRAVMLHARALEILTPLEVVPELQRHGLWTTAIDFLREDGARLRMDFAAIASAYAGILNIRQPEIERVLSDAFLDRGGSILRGFVVAGFRDSPLEVELDIVGPAGASFTTGCDWLFGCDGARSTIRRVLGASFEGSSLAHGYILGEGQPEEAGAPAVSSMLISAQGVVSWLPFADGSVRVAGPGRGLTLTAADSDDAEQAEIDLFRGEQAALVAAPCYRIGKIDRAARYQVHSRVASAWGRGRVWLAGDAAHIHPPAGGQALNLGFGDAEALALRLDRRSGLSFDSYEAERRPIAEATLNEVVMMPLVAAIRQARSEGEFEALAGILAEKAHRLSQVDTNPHADGPARLGSTEDQRLSLGRRLPVALPLSAQANGWRLAQLAGAELWVLADRIIRRISPSPVPAEMCPTPRGAHPARELRP